MENGFESRFRDRQTNPNPSSAAANGFGYVFSRTTNNGDRPFSPFAAHGPRSWYHRQGLTSVVSSIPNRGLTSVVSSIPNRGLTSVVNSIPNRAQKTFLVFDQSNDQTTLVYSSDIGAAPVRYNLPKPPSTLHRKTEISTSRFGESVEENDGSEMREDTEELNALLYSDDEEEMSTGHSPSSITGSDGRRDDGGGGASGARKRRKVENAGGYDEISLEDTASSGKSGVNCSDKVESGGSGGGDGAVEEESGGGGRARREKVRETLSILENLIPGEKNGKDAVEIIDEAIQYLRSLKVKVKALGFDSL